MPFVRRKKISGADYFYLVQGVRENGQVRQQVIAYLGKFSSVESAFSYWASQRTKPEKKAHAEKMMRKLRPYL